VFLPRKYIFGVSSLYFLGELFRHEFPENTVDKTSSY